MQFISGLSDLPSWHGERVVIAGDFNQRMPRARQPKYAFEALSSAVQHYTWATSGEIAGVNKLSIDHKYLCKSCVQSENLCRLILFVTYMLASDLHATIHVPIQEISSLIMTLHQDLESNNYSEESSHSIS